MGLAKAFFSRHARLDPRIHPFEYMSREGVALLTMRSDLMAEERDTFARLEHAMRMRGQARA